MQDTAQPATSVAAQSGSPTSATAQTSAATQTSAPPRVPLTVLSISAVADPSLQPQDVADPYSELDKYTLKIYRPDQKLYNALFRAVADREKSFDLTAFDLPYLDKYNTAYSLYREAGYRLFDLHRERMGKDGKKVTFTYNDVAPDAAARDSVEFCARLSHLLYDVTPEDYTDLQKVISVFDYLCRISSYAEQVSDESTQSPYSILMKGQGICGGYASLVYYALHHAGVPVEYVCNEAHAWDIVQLNGNWYHTDVTWGAGLFGDSSNSLSTVLMDDSTRHSGLDGAGLLLDPTVLGPPRENAVAPPPCTDKSYTAYGEVAYIYSLDIENGKVYFASSDGIDRMNLDCTGRETVAPDVYPNLMAFFNGKLYFVDSADCLLYELDPGRPRALLYGAEPTRYLELSGTTLLYGPDAAGVGRKAMDLLPVDMRALAGARALPAETVPSGRSFSFHVRFSAPADAAQDWTERVYLIGADGKALSLHCALADGGKELTVRPKDFIGDRTSLTLYVRDVLPVDGAAMEGCSRFDLAIGR